MLSCVVCRWKIILLLSLLIHVQHYFVWIIKVIVLWIHSAYKCKPGRLMRLTSHHITSHQQHHVTSHFLLPHPPMVHDWMSMLDVMWYDMISTYFVILNVHRSWSISRSSTKVSNTTYAYVHVQSNRTHVRARWLMKWDGMRSDDLMMWCDGMGWDAPCMLDWVCSYLILPNWQVSMHSCHCYMLYHVIL